ncbi:hypothetical protein MHF_0618 [Mycoplasma haemofelis Ohio2]|uniref:Uncharacterized protein n=1 Tax=Mycoplasma haemofelis (strain Ohio2) TaxID=859194 RepID=F6FI42_MYCHI|nr:hypothetical protein MHF_0618 [Mycoplasma haemofelis Ohio2]
MALSGYGFYYLFHRSIGDRIASSLGGKKKRFLGKEDREWPRLQSKYESSSNKPKKEDGKTDLPFSELPQWCEVNYHGGFSSDKQDIYEKVARFCFYNTNTLLANLSPKRFRSQNGSTSSDWIQAQKEYKDYVTRNGVDLAITNDSSVHANASSSSSVGGAFMHKWCHEHAHKKMYEAGELLPIFERWCTK